MLNTKRAGKLDIDLSDDIQSQFLRFTTSAWFTRSHIYDKSQQKVPYVYLVVPKRVFNKLSNDTNLLKIELSLPVLKIGKNQAPESHILLEPWAFCPQPGAIQG